MSSNGDQIFSAGIDNEVQCWDMKTRSILYRLQGHQDSITGLSLSPDSFRLMSTSMDNSCRIWDVKPYSSIPDRLLCCFGGAPHGRDKNLIKPAWNCDASMVSCGSGDGSVVVWSPDDGRIMHKLPGHRGTVNQCDFHPTEPRILATCSEDSTLILADLLGE